MHNYNSFKDYMKSMFGDAWISTYKANPSSFKQMYFTASNLGATTTFDKYYENFNMNIILDMGVKLDELSNTPQYIYAGSIYKTDNQIMKLATKIYELSGVTIDESRAVLSSMMNSKKLANQNPTFDPSIIVNELNEILDHENIVLNFETSSYARVVGKDGNGRDIMNTLNPTDLNSIISVNQYAKKLNTDNAVDAKILVGLLQYNAIQIRDNKLKGLLEDLQYNEKNADFADKYFKTWHEVMEVKESLPVFITMMKHFTWQIKRRMMERPTFYDIMVSLYGNQGIGKSFLVNGTYGSVLDRFYNASISLDNLMDERWTVALNTQFLMNIEEMDSGKMGNISGKNLAMIKKVITGSEATYRPMGTNTTQSVKIKTSFISNANFHIYDIINDESGMRRFIEFNSAIEKGRQLDHNIVAKLIEFAPKMFTSINENLEKGYFNPTSEVGLEVARIQESYVKKPAINEFAESLEYDRDMKYGECMEMDAIYALYESYCSDQRVDAKYRTTKKNFRKKMEDLVDGCTKVQGNVYRFCVKSKEHEYQSIAPAREAKAPSAYDKLFGSKGNMLDADEIDRSFVEQM